jgi:hypothetical protein
MKAAANKVLKKDNALDGRFTEPCVHPAVKTLSVVPRESCRNGIRPTLILFASLIPLLLIYLNAAAFGSSAYAASSFPHFLRSTPSQYSGCPGAKTRSARFGAVDFSQPADEALMHAAKAHGVIAILRYYDWNDDTPDARLSPSALSRRSQFNRQFLYPWRSGPQFHGKILTRDELTLLHEAGFKVGVVFQHFNSDRRTFTDSARARFDASQALDEARNLHQPLNTFIFFGVDFDTSPSMYPYVRHYFTSVRERLRIASFKLGVYGNGHVCKRLFQDGLVSACWLSQSVGFRESVDYERSGEWVLKQCATRKPFSESAVEFDPDVIRGKLHGLFW